MTEENVSHEKYTFIHIPKCGGTPVEWYFNDNYKEHIIGMTHSYIATTTNKPIIIIRNPIERFISLYHYWKNGSHGRNSRPAEFHEKYGNFSIKQFIELIKNNQRNELVYGYTWREHYYPQVHWISSETYKNAIVITYVPDLQEKIYKLFDFIQIKNKFIPLGKKNETRKKEGEENVKMDEDDIQWLKEYYPLDFILWENANDKPEMFLHVI
jgi:hypothetical protein